LEVAAAELVSTAGVVGLAGAEAFSGAAGATVAGAVVACAVSSPFAGVVLLASGVFVVASVEVGVGV